jgi:hypothetical protein
MSPDNDPLEELLQAAIDQSDDQIVLEMVRDGPLLLDMSGWARLRVAGLSRAEARAAIEEPLLQRAIEVRVCRASTVCRIRRHRRPKGGG